ncbi:protein of unknown function [Streptantibioticus cattleyicolor NRRL 8057 = DSM 46488]|nr:protein of unknown function [Streptantibioticus cattleyicolor NRRL 8057 = DSM 46488]
MGFCLACASRSGLLAFPGGAGRTLPDRGRCSKTGSGGPSCRPGLRPSRAAGQGGTTRPSQARTPRVARPATPQTPAPPPPHTTTSAHTVFPGAPTLGTTPHRAATSATIHNPRPSSASGPGTLGRSGGIRSPRVSVTSTRTTPSSAASRNWKSRPGTCPWCTAFAASSPTTSTTASYAAPPGEYPHPSNRRAANLLASRAPRSVGVKHISNFSVEGTFVVTPTRLIDPP